MSAGSSEDGEPDMTAMLDMVFQLITFFMLVINFKAASMDLELKLPVVGSARPVETPGQDLLILNINKKGDVKVFGQVKDNIEDYIAVEAQASSLVERRKNPDWKQGDELNSIVVIRADEATPFKLLNRVIKACQDNGFRNFSMKAKSAKS